jgi:hypothetical protein
MHSKHFAILVLILVFPYLTAVAQQSDVSFTIGGSVVSDTKATSVCVTCNGPILPTFVLQSKFMTGHQFAFEGAIAHRILNFKVASLHAELPFTIIPSQRLTANDSATLGHFTSTFITPS